MDWDAIKDKMQAILGAVFLFISILLIPEIRRKRKYWITCSIGVVILLLLGIDKISRDSKFQIGITAMGKEISRANSNVERTNSHLDILQKEQSEFLNSLKSIGIGRDTLNRPYVLNKQLLLNYQNVGKSGSGFQNNGNNYGYQSAKGVTINNTLKTIGYETKTFIADEGQTEFTDKGFPKEIDKYIISLNGMEVPSRYYSVINNKVIFSTGLQKGSDVVIRWIK